MLPLPTHQLIQQLTRLLMTEARANRQHRQIMFQRIFPQTNLLKLKKNLR